MQGHKGEMRMDYGAMLLLSASAGFLGTGLGGLIAILLPRLSSRAISRILHFTGGLMISIVCFELLPEALVLDESAAILSLLLGIAVMLLSDVVLTRFGKRHGGNSLLRSGMLIGIGIALHNFPEGLAVGAGYADAPVFGLALCLAIVLHDVPEGLSMALPLREGGMKLNRVLLSALFSGLPTLLGAIIGQIAGGTGPQALAICLGLAGGAMLQITCASLLPEAQKKGAGRLETLLLSLGIVAGCLLALWL